MQLSNRYLEQRTWNDFCSSISGFTWLAEPNKVRNTNDSRFFSQDIWLNVKCYCIFLLLLVNSNQFVTEYPNLHFSFAQDGNQLLSVDHDILRIPVHSKMIYLYISAKIMFVLCRKWSNCGRGWILDGFYHDNSVWQI